MSKDYDLWNYDSAVDWNDCYETSWEVDEEQEEEKYEKMIEEHEEQQNKEIEIRAFRDVAGQGVHAPAFRDDLDTLEMIKLKKRFSLREIGRKLGCSPNTVKNRIKCFNLHR